MPKLDDPTSVLLARRIRALRTDLEMTSAEFCDRTGINAQKLARIERCDQAVQIPELALIAAALATTPDALMRPGSICPTCDQEIPE